VEETLTDERQQPETPSAEWFLDQLAKSRLFHEKLHEWELLKVADEVEKVRGEELTWDLTELRISPEAWSKVIHRGIKPVRVFAHPSVLERVPGAVAYYRMLAMVSQKSMSRLGLPIARYEPPARHPLTSAQATAIAGHLNQIISQLTELDEDVDTRELDLWRGMAAGTQAQGSWQNAKGEAAEAIVKDLLREQFRRLGSEDGPKVILRDGRVCVFGDDPDVAVYEAEGGLIQIAVEIKGGIDAAGVLERVGAAVKSLTRAKHENPNATTVLILRRASVTPRALNDLQMSGGAIDHWFTIEDILSDPAKLEQVLSLITAS